MTAPWPISAIWHVASHDGARANHDSITDGDAFQYDGAVADICNLAQNEPDQAEQDQLDALASVLNEGAGCNLTGAPVPEGAAPADTPAAEEGGSLGRILLIGLVFLLIIAGISLVLMRRNAVLGDEMITSPVQPICAHGMQARMQSSIW